MRLSPLQEKFVAAFNAAAQTYDSATPVQREVARALVERAAVSRARRPNPRSRRGRLAT